MSPSRKVKAAGFRSLKEVAEAVGRPVQTLINWHRGNPKLFNAVLDGLVSQRKPKNFAEALDRAKQAVADLEELIEREGLR